MGNLVDNKFTWVIQNFNTLESETIYSDEFVVGGCKWHLSVDPKGDGDKFAGYLSSFLESEPLPCGSRRLAKFSLTLVNQLSHILSQKRVAAQQWFDEKILSWGWSNMLLLTRLQERDSGFLVNGELKITVEVDVLEVIGKLDESVESEETTKSQKKRKQDNDLPNKTQELKEGFEVSGFLVLPSQVESVKRIFEKHPDITSGVHTKSPHLRTMYINVLLGLIQTLCQSPQDLSDDDLKEASITVSYAINIGFKLDWLEKKLIELCEKKTILRTVETKLPEMEEELENLKKRLLELDGLLEKSQAEVDGAKIPLSFEDIV